MKLTPVAAAAAIATVTLLSSRPPAFAQGDSAPFANSPPTAPPIESAASGFGTAGQWVASMRTAPGEGFFYFHNPSGDGWEISLHPAIDYFLANRISIGGVFGYTYAPADSGTTTVDLGLRAGFNLDIGDRFGFWPMAGIAGRIFNSGNVTDTSSALQIFAPFLWHPVTHAFLGLGPSFNAGLSGGDYTEVGIDFMLGGWL
jgi:hypothetical protein